MSGYVYILHCSDGSYYTGSTKDIDARFYQHQNGEGAVYTKKRLPVKLLYVEEYERIDEAFYREKQIQGWRREKKEALIRGDFGKLNHLSKSPHNSALSPHNSALSPHNSALSLPKGGKLALKSEFDTSNKEYK
ncbi:MAG: GIY-YIG nuclease family protein [Alphaproteobacteria bacterium]|nr:GIY-YIG nuclease family protein [Alphaproteobacteria bacterium]